MNTANKLTLARVVAIPLFIVLLYWDFPHHLWVALGVFILASITDFVDGYVARHYNQITDFGKFMDPLADKLLVMSAMAWFVEAGWMPAWAFFIVIARELAVTGMRLVAVEQGRVIAAGKSGKVKTASTMVGICLMLAFPTEPLILICTIVILVTTVYSGVEYFVQNRDVFRDGAA
ncbi:MAG: CDP-diacylglycerol--glycerol-3-phosphate 3-phosphatidyltransferase [Ruminiclostridium sp.]|jgi:CDP-diacylglycerol--glycerol-3-phosphate 3-phosphatidyltransferase|nr:CDP-diacylglycerol--glycerol-3-phosphate 3-phosphatidyltransferase [Ruminiclostridium sp.]MCI9466792.1 CDP-diacylglycerol--glycerol-3-phosphate 3-phosphatidyltransferase [Ruminiclostridium sp.]